MIEVSGLSKRYGEITALGEVSFTVPKGQIVGFLGANGAGKTTTMDILCGCIGADTGSAKISGFDITEDPQEAKKRLGYLPDEPPLYNDMRVNDYVEFAGKLHKLGGAELKKKMDETIDKLSLGDVRKRLVGNLSKGYRQRVGLAQAIIHSPDVLVLDEPTEGLDPTQIVHIRDLIKSLAGEHTILLSSHILSEVQNTCDHIIIIHQGKIVQTGTYDEIIRSVDSSRHYTLQVANNPQGAVDALAGIGGISHVRLAKANEGAGNIEFNLDSNAAVLDQVAKLIIDKGFGLRELATSKKSLEEVFLKITH